MARGRLRHRKSIYDPIHGPIPLDAAALSVLATQPVQRLWGIRQTGFAHLVFPGANHTRLEHSLGAYSVAGRMASRLGLDADSEAQVSLAALLHDTGHGPFSHTLDGPMREVLGVGHEKISTQLVTGNAPGAGDAIPRALLASGFEPRAIARLIDPGESLARRSLLSRILHGPIDADRIDYLQRDAYYTGVAHGSIDAVRLLDTLEARDRELQFVEKGRSAVEGFLVGRSLMYRAVYYHKTVRSAELMLQAAIERLTGYPEEARGLFSLTDGELFAELRSKGERGRTTVRALQGRQLFKRVGGLRTVSSQLRRRLRYLLDHPPRRRELEADLTRRVGGVDGDVLLDLSGSVSRTDRTELREIRIAERGAVHRPFARPPWDSLLLRPATEWPLGVYSPEALRRKVERELLPHLEQTVAG